MLEQKANLIRQEIRKTVLESDNLRKINRHKMADVLVQKHKEAIREALIAEIKTAQEYLVNKYGI